ncbi:MAG: DegT/DnrJ/EryC1/StrS family aminotransferase, partial [Gammaproteobacteria bacterium]
MNTNLLEIPRLPVLGWDSFTGERAAQLPSILNLPNLRYTTSGRAAIALALTVLNVRSGDKVLVPTYHCPTMIAPIVRAGATPVFFPVDALGAPDLTFLDAMTPRYPRALLAVHYFGLPQHFSALRAWCDRRDVAFIEDCAHAFFGISDAHPVG